MTEHCFGYGETSARWRSRQARRARTTRSTCREIAQRNTGRPAQRAHTGADDRPSPAHHTIVRYHIQTAMAHRHHDGTATRLGQRQARFANGRKRSPIRDDGSAPAGPIQPSRLVMPDSYRHKTEPQPRAGDYADGVNTRLPQTRIIAHGRWQKERHVPQQITIP